ncbi:MAG: lytic transglycosylase domain-containing protein [Acidobacteriota bacterium]
MRILLLICLFFSPVALGGRIESYVGQDGIKVFTNLGTDRRAEGPSSPSHLDQFSFPGAEADSYDYSPLIQEIAQRYGVDDNLVKAIITVESDFDHLAISPKNCKGLMQLHPDTARRFGVMDVFDPVENIEGGVKYLQFLMNHFNNELPLVLAAYNAGENAVKRYQGIPPYRETQAYVQKVTALYDVSDAGEGLPEPTRQSPRIERLVTPEGRVIFTNVPAEVSLN